MKLPIADCRLPIETQRHSRVFASTGNRQPATGNHAFTLIEIMIVVAIIGLIAAMGLPSIMKALQKEGMRKAVSDVVDICETARANAIIHGQAVAVMIRPGKRTFEAEGGAAAHSGLVSSTTLPDGVDMEALYINQQDYTDSEWALVWFYPDGTCNEMTLLLHDRDDWRKIKLEFATGLPTVSDADQ